MGVVSGEYEICGRRTAFRSLFSEIGRGLEKPRILDHGEEMRNHEKRRGIGIRFPRCCRVLQGERHRILLLSPEVLCEAFDDERRVGICRAELHRLLVGFMRLLFIFRRMALLVNQVTELLKRLSAAGGPGPKEQRLRGLAVLFRAASFLIAVRESDETIDASRFSCRLVPAERLSVILSDPEAFGVDIRELNHRIHVTGFGPVDRVREEIRPGEERLKRPLGEEPRRNPDKAREAHTDSRRHFALPDRFRAENREHGIDRRRIFLIHRGFDLPVLFAKQRHFLDRPDHGVQRVRAGVPVHIVLKRLIASVLEKRHRHHRDQGAARLLRLKRVFISHPEMVPGGIREHFLRAFGFRRRCREREERPGIEGKTVDARPRECLFEDPEPGHRGGEIHEAPSGLYEHLTVIPIDIAAGRPDVTRDFGSRHHGAECRGHQRNARRAVRTVDRGSLAAASIKPHAPEVIHIGVFRELMKFSVRIPDEFKRFRPDLVTRPGLSK